MQNQQNGKNTKIVTPKDGVELGFHTVLRKVHLPPNNLKEFDTTPVNKLKLSLTQRCFAKAEGLSLPRRISAFISTKIRFSTINSLAGGKGYEAKTLLFCRSNLCNELSGRRCRREKTLFRESYNVSLVIFT